MLLLVASLSGGCHGKDDEVVPDEGEYPPSALVLVLDGVRVEELTSTFASDVTGVSGEEYAHKLWADVAPDAAVVRAAINPGVTITAPGHLEMLTGRVDALANYATDFGAGLYRPELPTLFEELRSQLDLPAGDALLLANTELLLPATSSLYPGLGEDLGATYEEMFDPEKPDAPINDDTPVMDELKNRIREDHPRFMVVNFHDVDRAGHYGGEGAYPGDVEKLDGLLAEFWRWLADHEPGYQRDLLVVITADHGRHRHDEDNGWHNHGDSCTGCREVPLLLLGPGVRAGEEVADTTTLWDYGPTLAAHLGVDLPWAQGLPIAPAFDTLDAPARSGEVGVGSAGTHVVATRYLDGYEARSEVVLDGVVVSGDDALVADGASLYEDVAGPIACFRELRLTPGELFWPWAPRCLRNGEDLGFPESEVGTDWRPAFASDGDALWVAYNHNPDGIGELGVDDEVGLRVRRFVDGAWSDPLATPAYFPVEPSLVPTAEGAAVAFGTNASGDESRYTRHIRVLRVSDGLTLLGESDIDLSPWLGDPQRAERATLTRLGDGRLALAILGIGADARDVYVVTSEDEGATWGEPVALGVTEPLFAHLTPRWDGDAVVYAVLAEGEAELCRQAIGSDATCVSAGSPRVDSFSVTEGVVTASVDTGVGAWEVRSFVIP
jgi:hypothetical protein